MAVTAAQLQELYLAYFGRPADFNGVAFYTANPNASVADVAIAFSTSAESQALYGTGFNPAVINAIYNNLFNRDAEPEGLLFWTQAVASGGLSPAAAALQILQSAQNDDAIAIQNKLAVATALTNGLTNAQDILGYAGDAAAAVARAFLHGVTWDPATVTAAMAQIADHSIYDAIDNVGGIPGTTFNLTAGADTFSSPSFSYVDTINGVIDQSAADKSTFSSGDKITGNGKTVVNVALKDVSGGKADVVTMSGINKLQITNGTTSTAVAFDGSQWTNVSKISLNGADGMTVSVSGLKNAAATGLKVAVDGATKGAIDLSKASVGTWAVNGSIENTTHNSVGATASFGSAGVDLVLGKGGSANIAMAQSKTSSKASVSVGDIVVGHVNVVAGASASVNSFTIANYAAASATAATKAHSATVGNLSLGDVTLKAGDAADITSANFYNEASASGFGNATAGNLTVGAVNVHAGSGADVTGYFSNLAYADTGKATVGNVTVGNVTVGGTGYASAYFENYASVNVKGNATAGNMTVGDVTLAGTSATDSHSAYFYNSAYANVGNATVGNLSIGNVQATNGYYGELWASNSASAASGNATVGNISVGNVTLNATGTGDNYVGFENYAYANNGVGKAGNVTVGNIGMTVATGSNDLYVTNEARGYGANGTSAAVGNITVGNITMDQAAAAGGGSNYVAITNSARANTTSGVATAGNIVVGDISVNVGGITQADASNKVYVTNSASGASAIAGTITVGNITARTGVKGELVFDIENNANGASGGETGLVTVGNVSMQGSKSASMWLYVSNSNSGVGSAGGVTVGNISMVGDKAVGTAHANVYNYAASGEAGNVKVGNVNLTAAHVYLNIENYSPNGKAGSLTVGNVTLKGNNTGWNYISNYAEGAVGAMSVGNVALSVGMAQTLKLYVANESTAAAAGNLTLGNISLSLADKDANSKAGSYAKLQAYTDGGKGATGNITAGNITVGASGVTTKAAMTAAMQAHVTISSVDGTVKVGDITITGGGVKESGGGKILTDNLDVLGNWLHLTSGAGSITIGNVDYSAYAGASTIDVHGYAGAATIKSSKGGSTIYDNKGANTFDLTASATKADAIFLQSAQSGVKDSGGAVTASQTGLDTIIGWGAGDSIHIADAKGVTVGIAGNGLIVQNTPAQDYATFLLHAETQITSGGNSAYVAVIGGNTYVAMNVGGKVGEVVEFMGSHTFNLAGDTAGYQLSFLS